jgi:hypothetical protein
MICQTGLVDFNCLRRTYCYTGRAPITITLLLDQIYLYNLPGPLNLNVEILFHNLSYTLVTKLAVVSTSILELGLDIKDILLSSN